MKRLLPALFAMFFAALCAPLAHAQDPQKPAAAPQQPDAKPAEAASDKPKPGPGQPADPEIIGKIFACLNSGLPPDWKKTWFIIKEISRNEGDHQRSFEAKFLFVTDLKDSKGKKLSPCGGEPVIEGVKALNDYLPPDQQGWTAATFTFIREGGKFDATYDYTPFKPAPDKPAAKPAAKKAAKKADSSSKQ